MRSIRTFGAALALVAVAMLAACAHAPTTPATPEQILAVDREVAAAHVARDVAALDRLLADDLRIVRPNGVVVDKPGNLDEIRTGRRTFDTLEAPEAEARVRGDVAIVTGRARSTGSYQGKPVSGEFRFTRVYERRDGRWQLTLWQATPIPKS